VSPPSHLKPSESLTEIVAGLIMVLTFTLAASVLTGGGQDGARAALLGAIGCNAAWGIIDAVFYMMTSAFDRNRRLRLARAIAATQDEAAALAAIRSELDPYLASVTRAEDRSGFTGAFTTCWPMDGCRGEPACYLTMSWVPSRCSASRSPPRSRRRCRFC
jgi:hypothetical protein